MKVVIPFKYWEPNRKFTPLPDTLCNTMLQILDKNFNTLPPIRTLNPTKLLLKIYIPNAYFDYHQQNEHDIE